MNTESLKERINTAFENNEIMRDFTGYIYIKQGNSVVFKQSFGFADYQNKRLHDSRTIFNIGSMTKQFTAAAVLLLQQKGALSIDDPLGKYLIDFENGKQLVIRDLLNMNSGMPEYWCKPDWQETVGKTTDDTYKFIKALTDYLPARKEFKYCNSNYIVLGKLVEKVSELTLGGFLLKEIFAPLKMKRTFFLDLPENIDNIAVGYRSPRIAPWQEAPKVIRSFGGAGGIFTCAEDLDKWDSALYTNELLSNHLITEMFKPALGGYAMGWYINHDGAWHGGDIYGFSTRITRRTEQKELILMLCNSDGCKESNICHYSNVLMSCL